MANTANSIMTPQAAFLEHCNLSAVTACTTRGPTATASLAGANIVIAGSVNAVSDKKVSKIVIKGISTSFTAPTAAQIVLVWHWDGTNAYLIDEILTTVVTPSTTVASFQGVQLYDDLVIPVNHALYMAVSITTTASTTALQANIHGASM